MQPPFEKKPNPESSAKSNNQSKTIIIVMAAVIALLLIAGGLFVMDNLEKEAKIEEKVKENEDLDAEIKELEKEISAKENELTTTANEKEELLNQLKNLQEKITYYKFRTEKLMAEGNKSKEENEKLKGNIEQLRYYDEKNKKRIGELEEQIKVLTTQVTELQGTVQEKDRTINKLNDEVSTSAIKIEAGSKLQAAGFVFKFDYKNLFGSKSEENNDGEGTKAKKTNKITVKCKVMKNSIAPQGMRNFYVLIKSPSGKLYQSLNTVSGYFKVDGKDMVYSSKTTQNYSGSEMELTFEYQKGEKDEFEKGVNFVQVYAQEAPGKDNAFVIGNEKFTFR